MNGWSVWRSPCAASYSGASSSAEVDACHLCWGGGGSSCLAGKCLLILISSFSICCPRVKLKLPLGTIVMKGPSHHPHSCTNYSHLRPLLGLECSWDLEAVTEHCLLRAWRIPFSLVYLISAKVTFQKTTSIQTTLIWGAAGGGGREGTG